MIFQCLADVEEHLGITISQAGNDIFFKINDELVLNVHFF